MQGKDFTSELMPTMYIIAGCNGAGKTTASNTILPDILNCREFVNADNIAAGLSPFEAEKYAIEAGRLMLKRIDQLITEKVDFAIETTLSSKNYFTKIQSAKKNDYDIFICFFWLSSSKLAIERVRKRVQSGGHHIPTDTIKRRYRRGLNNFMDIYMPIVDSWVVYDNSQKHSAKIAQDSIGKKIQISDLSKWKRILIQYQKNTKQ
jgi:predicted ABC-type ATPase